MTKELADDVERTAKALEEARSRTENALVEFFNELAAELQKWLPIKVGKEVTRSHEITRQNGAEKIGLLKKELAALSPCLQGEVPKWFKKEHLWPHRKGYFPSRHSYTPSRPYDLDSRKPPHELASSLEEGLKKLLEPLLRKYGYSLYTGSVSSSYFHHEFVWGRSLNESLCRYFDENDHFSKKQNEHELATRKKGEHDAHDLWTKS